MLHEQHRVASETIRPMPQLTDEELMAIAMACRAMARRRNVALRRLKIRH